MKRLLFAVVLALILTGCRSMQQKAEKLATQHLKETLNDWSSYELVSFSSLDSLKSEWVIPQNLESDVLRLGELADAINALGYNGVGITNDADYHIEIIKKYPSEDNQKALGLWGEYKIIQERVYRDRDSYKPEFLGWKISHKYRARNQYNALMLREEEIHFDKDLTKIINIVSVDE